MKFLMKKGILDADLVCGHLLILDLWFKGVYYFGFMNIYVRR